MLKIVAIIRVFKKNKGEEREREGEGWRERETILIIGENVL